MYDKLVIVESPSKSKTIENYLGKEYHVTSSKGHIRDLSTSGKEGLGIDQEDHYKPKYVISKDKKDVVKELKAAVKEAKTVYLATDPDREGEAISWHLADVLGLDMDDDNRIVFNEVFFSPFLWYLPSISHMVILNLCYSNVNFKFFPAMLLSKFS